MPEYQSFEELFSEDREPDDAPVETPEEAPEEPAEEPEAEEPPEEPETDDEPEEEPTEPLESAEDGEEKPRKPPKEEKPPEPRIHKVQIDGEVREVDDAELVRGYATSKASNQRFQEAKRLHEEASAFYKQFESRNPADVLVDMAMRQTGSRAKAREMVRDALIEWLEPDIREASIEDPREKQLYHEKRQIADERADLDREKQAREARQEAESYQTFVNGCRDAIRAGLAANGLPDKDEVWLRAGQLVDSAIKAGTKREHALELIPAMMKQVADEREQTARSLVPTLSAEELARMFPEQVEALRQERIQKVKDERSKKRPAGEGKAPAQQKREKRPKYRSLDEVFGT